MVKSLRGLETIFIILLLSGVSLFALSQTNIRPKFNFGSVQLPASLPSPSPSTSPFSSKETTTVESPDGKATLVMEKQQIGNEVEYSASVINNENDSKTYLFSKTLNRFSEISIPFNTFSPDNLNIFLKEGKSFYVWKISQEAQTPSNISDLFSEKYPEFSLLDVTGWAAPDLLIVNIKNTEDVKSSYWFEVPSQSFIPLATGFY